MTGYSVPSTSAWTTGEEKSTCRCCRRSCFPAFPVRKVSVKYAYINEDSRYDVDVIQSKYAMEYLRHKINVSADGRIWRNLNLSVAWRWQERTGNNASYGLLDARLSWNEAKWSVFVDGTNILNKEYYDYISIRQPGIVVIGGIKIGI